MEYYEIKNLEKYQPSYKDGRKLIWIKWYVDSLGDYKFTKLSASQKWLFIGLSLLQIKEGGKVPKDHNWLCQQLQYDKKHITNDINVLHEFNLLVTKCDEMSQNVVLEKRREENIKKKREDIDGYAAFEQQVLSLWNSFCEKHPVLTKIKAVSMGRRALLKRRYEQDTFRDFAVVLEIAEKQKFLLGENDRKWKVNLDWLIKNDTNHLKVLEGKYDNGKEKTDGIPESLKHLIKPVRFGNQ